MSLRLDIISIGTLSRNRLWGESAPLRTPHATCTLIRPDARPAVGSGTSPTAGAARAGGTGAAGGPGVVGGAAGVILVDPGLPAPAIAARFTERTGMSPDAVTIIFLTNFRPAHRAGIAAFPKARILLHEPERDAVRHHLEALFERADGDEQTQRIIRSELDILARTRGAPDKLAPQVDIYPLPGYTPGTCGLLVAQATSTTLIAGDAVPTRDHLLAGQILPDPHDLSAAREALREVYEIADLIVPGHDNLFVNPRSFGG